MAEGQAQNAMNKKVIGIALILLVFFISLMYLMFGNESEEDQKKNQSKTSQLGNSLQVQQKENTNPLYKQELEKFNQEQSQLAEAQNRSNVKILNPNKEEKKQGQVIQQPQQQKMVDYQAKQKALQQKQEQERKEHMTKMTNLGAAKLKFFQMMQQSEGKMDLPVMSLDGGYDGTEFLNNSILSTSNIQVASDNMQEPKEYLVKGGEQFSATLDQALDTDINTEVFATIQSGKIKGANIMGRISMEGDYIRVSFNRMFYNGKTYSITAIGMDPETNMAVLSGDIDNRYLERFGYPFLVSLIQGAGQAMARTASSTVVSAGGAISTSNQEASDKAILGEAVSQGMNSVAQGVNQNARKNRVIRRPADAIIIRFLAEIDDTNINNFSTENQNNSNYFMNQQNQIQNQQQQYEKQKLLNDQRNAIQTNLNNNNLNK